MRERARPFAAPSMLSLGASESNQLDSRRRALSERCARVLEAYEQAAAQHHYYHHHQSSLSMRGAFADEESGELAERAGVETVWEGKGGKSGVRANGGESTLPGECSSGGATPTAHLDVQSQHQLKSMLLTLKRRLTTILQKINQGLTDEGLRSRSREPKSADIDTDVQSLAEGLLSQVNELELAYASEQQLLSKTYQEGLQTQRQKLLSDRREAVARERQAREELDAVKKTLSEWEAAFAERLDREHRLLRETVRSLETRNECLCAELRREQKASEDMAAQHGSILEQLTSMQHERDAAREDAKAQVKQAEVMLQASSAAKTEEHVKIMAEMLAQHGNQRHAAQQELAILQDEMSAIEAQLASSQAKVEAQIQQLEGAAARMIQLAHLHGIQARELDEIRRLSHQEKEQAKAERDQAVEEAIRAAEQSAAASLRDMQSVVVSQQRHLRELQTLVAANPHDAAVSQPLGNWRISRDADRAGIPQSEPFQQHESHELSHQGLMTIRSPRGHGATIGATRHEHLATPPSSLKRRDAEDSRAPRGPMLSKSPGLASPPLAPHPQYTGPQRYSALLEEYMSASRRATPTSSKKESAQCRPRCLRSELGWSNAG